MSDKNIIWEKKDSWYIERVGLTKPDGEAVETARLRHPGAAVLVPLTADNQLMMIRQYRLGVEQTILELPAGTREWDEDWLICAQRELREETGHRAARLDFVCDFWPGPGFSDEVLTVYVARDLTPDPLPMDFDEEIETVLIPFDEVVAMVFDGRIRDGKTMIAIARAQAWLASNP